MMNRWTKRLTVASTVIFLGLTLNTQHVAFAKEEKQETHKQHYLLESIKQFPSFESDSILNPKYKPKITVIQAESENPAEPVAPLSPARVNCLHRML